MSRVDIKSNISKYMRTKITKYMKNSLDSVELHTRKYGLSNGFFKSEKEGFYAIRKTILDEGNDIIRLFEVILEELEIRHRNSTIEVPDASS